MKMVEKIQKCVLCGESFPETSGKYWIPQHAAITLLGGKYPGEPISGFRCKKCSHKGKRRLLLFISFMALLFTIIILFSI
jgi:hypothetical protein